MTKADNFLDSQAALKALNEKTSKLSISVSKPHERGRITVSDYLKKLYAIKSSILDDNMEHFKTIIADMESPESVYISANEVQRSQIQLIVADLMHDSVSMQNRDAYIFGLAKVFDINERNKLGFIPLHLAVGRGKLKIASMLVRSGSDVNLQNDLGRAPLHIAVNKGITELASFLIAHGADIDVADRDLWTPLHWAARNHHLELLRLLIRGGAKLDPRTNKGLSPLDMSLSTAPTAPLHWHPMTAWHLVAYGAGHLSPCAFQRWLQEVLGGSAFDQKTTELRPVVSQLLLLFAKAALVDAGQLTEAADYMAPEDLNEARALAERPTALSQLCRTKVRALLRNGAGRRSFVDNAALLKLPTPLRHYVLLKT